MTKYFFKDKLYFYFGTVGKLEDDVWKDNGFDGKVGKLIGYNYCRLVPKIHYQNRTIDFGWLVFNSTVVYYK